MNRGKRDDVLRHLNGVPEEDRAALLRELLKEMETSKRQELLDGLDANSEQPNRGDLGARPEPMAPATTQDQAANFSPEDLERLTRSQIESTRGNIKHELLTCFALALAAAAGLIVLGVGLREGWYWLKSLL